MNVRVSIAKTASPVEGRGKRSSPLRKILQRPKLSGDGKSLAIRVPLKLTQRGGRKLVITPDGKQAPATPRPHHVDSALIKALARAFRWRKLLETGVHATLAEIAKAEKINPSYVSRVLRLTLLAPEIVEAILQGRHNETLSVERLLASFPVCWNEQRFK